MQLDHFPATPSCSLIESATALIGPNRSNDLRSVARSSMSTKHHSGRKFLHALGSWPGGGGTELLSVLSVVEIPGYPILARGKTVSIHTANSAIFFLFTKSNNDEEPDTDDAEPAVFFDNFVTGSPVPLAPRPLFGYTNRRSGDRFCITGPDDKEGEFVESCCSYLFSSFKTRFNVSALLPI